MPFFLNGLVASRIKQQELYAWQPIVTPGVVIAISLLISIIFIPAGLVAYSNANKRFELLVEYDDGEGVSACSITSVNEGYESIKAGTYEDCTVRFELPQDVDLNTDLFLYYQVSNFYQNHRRYVISRSDPQLLGEVSFGSHDEIFSDLEIECAPSVSLENADFNPPLIFYPCGMIAQSYFNDGIQFKSYSRDGVFDLQFVNTVLTPGNNSVEGATIDLTLNRAAVALQSDLDTLFVNPTNSSGNYPKYDTFQYLWQTYSQFSCYDSTDPSIRTVCRTWNEFVREFEQEGLPADLVLPGDCSQSCVVATDILVDEGGIRPPDRAGEANSNFGLRDENFINWMRTSAFPTFRKLYSKVVFNFDEVSPGSADESQLGFKKGDILEFKIIPNFLVSQFKGTKSLVLTTTGPLSSNTKALGLAYFITGLATLAIAALVFLKLSIRPRRLGDPQYLKFKSA